MRVRSPLAIVFALVGCGARTGLNVDSSDGGPDFDVVSPGVVPLPDGDADAATPATQDAAPDDVSDAPCVATASGAPPRLIAPLSTATVTSQRPTLRWHLADGSDGAQIDICRDRACATLVATFLAAGESATPPDPLRAGVYFWRAHGVVGSREPCPAVTAETSAVWEFYAGARSAAVDTSWGATLDVNGDGFADVVVSGEPTTYGPLATYLFLGSAQGLAAQPSTLPIPLGALGYGVNVASAGDLNGDGFGDLAVSAYDPNGKTNDEGVVYVTFGSAEGLTGAPITLVSPMPVAYAHFGTTLDGAGDVNGDGYADLVVSAAFPDLQLTGPPAFVFFGGPAGPGSPVPLVGGTVEGWVAGAGDVNGDGFGDVMVSARSPASTSPAPAFVLVFLGSDAGPSPTPIMLPAPVVGDGYFGRGIAGGADVNGDGFSDVVVGDVNGGLDAAYVYLGAAGPEPYGASPVPSATLAGVGASYFSGNWLASAGDVNGDGYGDIVLGSAAADAGDQTYVSLFFGGPQPLASSQTLLPPSSTLSNFGGQVAGIGDVDADGFADVAIGGYDSTRRAVVVDVAFGAAANPLAPSSLVTLAVSFSAGAAYIAGTK
ncbi:MAG: VCBS repeat-containing protein [Polyangiaceae bacterium]